MPEHDKATIKIDADITCYQRKLAQLRRETAAFVKDAQRSFLTVGRAREAASGGARSFAAATKQLRGRHSGSGLQKAFLPQVGIGGGIALGGRVVISRTTSEALKKFILSVIEQVVVQATSDLVSNLASRLKELSAEPESRGDLTNRRIESLRRSKGRAVEIEEEKTRKFIEETSKTLTTLLQRLRPLESQLRKLEETGQRDLSVEAGEELAFPLGEQLSSLRGSIDPLREKIEELNSGVLALQQALDEEVTNNGLNEQFRRIADCLQRLCDRLESFGQDIPFDRASDGGDTLSGGAGSGRLIPASFGNTGLGELNRNLAESAWRVQDLSTGFQEAGDAAEDYGSETRTLNGLIDRSNLQFNEQTGLIGALREQLPELGVDFAKVFDETTEQGRELNGVIDELGTSLSDAFSEGVFKGKWRRVACSRSWPRTCCAS